jgi:type I restriction enzyme R subunit
MPLVLGQILLSRLFKNSHFILEKIGEIPNRKYAVIIDEAHSSQGGEASKKMKEVLSAKHSKKLQQKKAIQVWKKMQKMK